MLFISSWPLLKIIPALQHEFFFIYPEGKDVARWDKRLLLLTSPTPRPRPAGSSHRHNSSPRKPMRAQGLLLHLQPGWTEQILGSIGRKRVLWKRRKGGEKETEHRTEEEMEKRREYIYFFKNSAFNSVIKLYLIIARNNKQNREFYWHTHLKMWKYCWSIRYLSALPYIICTHKSRYTFVCVGVFGYRVPALSPIVGVRLQDVHLSSSASHTHTHWMYLFHRVLQCLWKNCVCVFLQYLTNLTLDFRPIWVMRYLSDCAAINTEQPAPIIQNLWPWGNIITTGKGFMATTYLAQ